MNLIIEIFWSRAGWRRRKRWDKNCCHRHNNQGAQEQLSYSVKPRLMQKISKGKGIDTCCEPTHYYPVFQRSCWRISTAQAAHHHKRRPKRSMMHAISFPSQLLPVLEQRPLIYFRRESSQQQRAVLPDMIPDPSMTSDMKCCLCRPRGWRTRRLEAFENRISIHFYWRSFVLQDSQELPALLGRRRFRLYQKDQTLCSGAR